MCFVNSNQSNVFFPVVTWHHGGVTAHLGDINTVWKVKSTKVQTLSELRMRDTANWWAGLFCMRLLLVSR